MKSLNCHKRIYHFDTDTGRPVTLRVIQPSKSHGGWPGSDYQIREWKICRPGTAHMDVCTDEEVLEFEGLACLLDPKNVCFVEHPTLGRVATFIR